MQTNSLQPVTEKEEKVGALPLSQPSSRKPSLDTDFTTDLLYHIASFNVADEKAGHEEKMGQGEPEVYPYAQLAAVNRRFNFLFKEVANAERDRRVEELCELIVRGNPDQVTAILEKNPSLLLYTATVKDCAGYTIKATPYRAALACDDPQMTAIVQRYLIDLAGEEEALAQWNAQFPEGWEEAEQVRWQPLFDQLKVLDQAIRESAVGDITSSQDYRLTVREDSDVAVEHARFMSLLKATQDEPVKIGRTFNRHFMQAVARLWDTYFDSFRWQDPKRLFCWQRVFGGTQCFVPAADAASFIDWLKTEKLKNNRPQNRSMKIEVWNHDAREWVDSSFFPADGSSRLGVDYAILGGRAGGGGLVLDAAGLARGASWRCGRFLSVKNSCFSEIYAAICAPGPAP